MLFRRIFSMIQGSHGMEKREEKKRNFELVFQKLVESDQENNFKTGVLKPEYLL